MRFSSWIFPIVCLTYALRSFAQVSVEQRFDLDPEMPYQAMRSNEVTYEVDFSIVVTPPAKTKKLKVWLPLPSSDMAQEVSESRLSTFPIKVEANVGKEPQYGNQFAFFEFDSPQGAQIIRHKFKIKVWELNWNLDPQTIIAVEKWPGSFEKYQRNEEQAVVVDERFMKMLNEIIPNKTIAGQDFEQVIDWVQANFEYDHQDASLSASSVHGLEKQRGHCSDYHGFCASMGRALGVPTRVTYGIAPFPKSSPSHCKLEAYLAPYGWVSFDVSETQKLMKAIQASNDLSTTQKSDLIDLARQRMEKGFRDNTWFLQTKGTDYELVPKASRRVAVVRTAYIEADGVPLPEPDPADKTQTKFAWMTVHKYQPSRFVPYPFSDWTILQPNTEEEK